MAKEQTVDLLNEPLPVTNDTIEHFLSTMLRHDALLQLGLTHLKPKMFNKIGESVYSIVWQTLTEFRGKFRRMPTYEAMSSLARSRATQFTDITLAEVEAIDPFLRWAFSRDLTDADIAVAGDYFRAFLFDRTVGEQLTSAASRRRAGTSIDVPKLLEEVAQVSRMISTVAKPHDTRLTSALRESPPQPCSPTGVPWLDRLMCGGVIPTETYVVLGPTGVGKTLVGVQVSVAYAKTQMLRAAQGHTPKLAVYVSYEASKNELAIRAISNAAYIDKGRLEQNFNELSTKDNLQPYEQEMYALCDQSDMFVMGEQERMAEASEWLDKYLQAVDFSNNSTSIGGYGGIPEVRATLQNIQEKTGLQIGLVISDWAGMAVRRKLRTDGMDKLVAELSDYVTQYDDTISGPFNCSTFIMHQLSSKLGSRAPTVAPTHTEADWCTAFANNADYAICLGTKDRQSNACLVTASKTRRSESIPTMICRINGAFSELLAADDELKIDRATRRLVACHNAIRVCDTVSQRSQRYVAGVGDFDHG
jgi:RecA/RadA recombinase